VEISGLPSGVDADISIEGPEGTEIVTAGQTLEVDGGAYFAIAYRVTDDDPIVRTVYDPESPEPAGICLKAGGSETLTVTYRGIPSSNKLWTSNANGDHAVCAFDSASLVETAEVDATVNFDGPAGNEIAFDKDGNLWSVGPTTADPHLVRFPADSLGHSGPKEPDRSITIADLSCLPAIFGMAFDASGNLWLSTCGEQVVRVDADDLEADGEVTTGVAITDVTNNGDLAFDLFGNLWVVSDGVIARYDASRLEADDSDPPDLLLTGIDPDTANPLGVQNFAFDAAGNLWVTDFGGNLVYRIDAVSLDETDDTEVAASTRIAIGVTALIDRPAFDESGGLWIGLGGGGIARLSPAQLTASTTPGDPTTPEVVITSADLGSVARVGFFPAPANLPLFHSLP
jgi:sugar lactone lactonase YvrE